MAASMGTLKPFHHPIIENVDPAMSFQSLSFASSQLSGDKLMSPLSFCSRRFSSNKKAYHKRAAIMVSPKAVSDSSNSQTCLDPDASQVSAKLNTFFFSMFCHKFYKFYT